MLLLRWLESQPKIHGSFCSLQACVQLIARKLKFPGETGFFQDPSLTPRNLLSSSFCSFLGKSEISEGENILMVAVWPVCSVSQLMIALPPSFTSCGRAILGLVIVNGESKVNFNSTNSLSQNIVADAAV